MRRKGSVGSRQGGWQQAVDVDLAFGAEVDLAVGDGGNGEAKSDAGAVALRVLFGVVKFAAYVGSVESVENGWFVRWLVPILGCRGPDNSVLCAVGGDGRSCAGIEKASSSGSFQFELAVAESEVLYV